MVVGVLELLNHIGSKLSVILCLIGMKLICMWVLHCLQCIFFSIRSLPSGGMAEPWFGRTLDCLCWMSMTHDRIDGANLDDRQGIEGQKGMLEYPRMIC